MPTYPQQAGVRPGPGGAIVAFNITAPTQIVTEPYGVVFRVFVNTAPSVPGGVYDMAAGGTASADNLIAIIPTTSGPVEILAPFYSGLYINPGTGGVVSVTYDP